MTVILNIQLKDQTYPIYIGAGLLQQLEYLIPHIQGSQVMIVTNTQVAPLYLAAVQQFLQPRYQCDVVILPDGEAYKTWDQLLVIFNALIENNHDRDTTLIALGGGVIGDMTGFAAAVYCRGVHFIQIPTSLLAQVDASVGGKTAVNHPLGKNFLGAFHQPQCVLIDPNTLLTLPDRELHSGLAEVIKHALLADVRFFEWLEKNMPLLLTRDRPALLYAIQRCVEIKAHIVEQDEYEKNIRAWLNLGHTVAHAIEYLTDYSGLHGEAVAVGLVAAIQLSQKADPKLKEAAPELLSRTIALLQSAGLPVVAPDFPVSAYLEAMQRDKKNKKGQLTFVLLHAVGGPYVSTVSIELVTEVLYDIMQSVED